MYAGDTKDDYTQPNAYRPISLLTTLVKALEAVVATRILYLAEEYGLLPENHLGLGSNAVQDKHCYSLPTISNSLACSALMSKERTTGFTKKYSWLDYKDDVS